MAYLTFVYGTMESGKTTKLLQDRYNYLKHGHNVLLCKSIIDTKADDNVINRTNDKAKVDVLLDENGSFLTKDILKKVINSKVILVDEAQFLNEKQVKELWEIAHAVNVNVICYGLKSDFRGVLFEGTRYLIGYADFKSELTTRCECGEIANFNARMVNGKFVFDGDVVAIDGKQNVSYVPLCGKCYFKKAYDKNRKSDILVKKKVLKKY